MSLADIPLDYFFTAGFALLAGLLVGAAVGWGMRARRARRDKLAINAGWQDQLEAQRLEHDRLVDQNRSLMAKINRFQTASTEAANRNRELSNSLKEALERRDSLTREITDVRSNLEAALTERRQLESEMKNLASSDSSQSAALRKRDEKIFNLSRQLEDWQQRVPPLVERYRERNSDAERLEFELAAAREKIRALESMLGSEETRVEPVDPHTLSESLDASNEPVAMHDDAHNDVDRLRDDLKRIKGIGPAIEKTLNELGIFRFRQIADMSEYDIDRVASRLKGFRTRIYREDWIGQARELAVEASDSLH